jgi:O-antigen/teichoic acid export membrane protein
VREDRGSLRQPLAAIMRTMLVAGGLALTVVLLIGPPLFGTIFGSEWDDAGDLLFALAPLHFSIFASAPSGLTLQVLGRTDLLTALSAARLAAPIAGISAGHALGWSLTASLGLYAATMVVISALVVATAWRLSSRG